MTRPGLTLLLVASLAGNAAAAQLSFGQVRVSPKAPTVGDLIRLEFATGRGGRVLLDPSPDLEIVSQRGGQAVIRTFRPGPLALTGRLLSDGRDIEFRNLSIEIHSVLAPGDALRPAPLRPPLPLPRDRRVDGWLGALAAAAAVLWTAVFFRHRLRPVAEEVPLLPAREEFIEAVERARMEKGDGFLLILSDAIRRYFARTDQRLGRDLTRTEFLEVIGRILPDGQLSIVSSVLSQADWLKFSGSRTVPAERSLIDRALDLLPADSIDRQKVAA